MELLAMAVLLVAAVAAQNGPGLLRGFHCNKNSQPWTAALFDGWKFHCTGTLINSQWLVTAAQCFTNRAGEGEWPGKMGVAGERVWSRETPKGQRERDLEGHTCSNAFGCLFVLYTCSLYHSFFYVALGENSLLSFEGTEQLKIGIKAIRHPFYNSFNKDNDIMLVKLLTPIRLTDSVQPLALPSSCVDPGSYCVVAGWGTPILQKEYPPDILYCGNITTLTDQECLAAYPAIHLGHMLCATVKMGGSDSCQGDPGSPLVCRNALQGITSWGFEKCSEVESPSVFVKVCNYVNWLRETMALA
ncbi:trypsin-like [Podarcis raffonei]|uniref:trypsin-like n=1 Tax=Podarcis raffonei TaxID=65483 RepID=UPI00232990B6|nr:trypsin-like [Podarcis raffonei]